MTTLVSTAGEVASPTKGLGAEYEPFEHHGMYAFLARARTEEPVFFCPEINYWVVTRREDILPLLQETQRFSADIALAPATPLTPEAVAILTSGASRAWRSTRSRGGRKSTWWPISSTSFPRRCFSC